LSSLRRRDYDFAAGILRRLELLARRKPADIN
jgi:hypothetical protein